MGRKQNIEEEYWRRELMKKYGAQAGLSGLFTDQTDPERARAQDIISRSKNMSLAELRDFVQNPEAQVGGPASPQSAAMSQMVAQDMQEGRGGPAPAPAATPSRKSSTRGKSATGIAALVPSSGGEPDAAAYGPSSVQGMAPPLSKAAEESESDMLKRYAEMAGGYMKGPRDALAKAQQEEQENGKKGMEALKNESKGVAALLAARALVDPKNQSSDLAGLGAAFGAAGETGAEYGKQKRAFEKDLEKSRMDAAKAEVAFKQGDFELGSKLMSMSQDRKLKAAELAAQTAYREAMVALQGTQLSEQARHNRATEIAEERRTAVLRETGLARASGKTGYTDAQKQKARNDGLGKLQADLKDRSSPAARALRSGVPQEQLVEAYADYMLTGEPLKLPSLQLSSAPGEVVGKLQVPNR